MINTIQDIFLLFIQNPYITASIIIIGYIVKHLIARNNELKNIIETFSKKLPPSGKSATNMNHPHLAHLSAHTHLPSLSQNDIDSFIREIENYKYNWILLKKEHHNIISSILTNRNATNAAKNTQLIFLQHTIEYYDGRVGFFELIKYKYKYLFNRDFYKRQFYRKMYNITKNPKWVYNMDFWYEYGETLLLIVLIFTMCLFYIL